MIRYNQVKRQDTTTPQQSTTYKGGNSMKNNKLETIIKAAKEHTIVNTCETFVYENEDGEYRYCNLKTLNYIANELHENIKILYNIYQNSITARINPFCEPIVSKMN